MTRQGFRAALSPLFVLIAACASPPQDRDPSLLQPPREIAPLLKEKWTVARRAPAVEFLPLPLEPIKAAAPPSGETPRQWTVWGQGTIDPETGVFYGAVGDHAGLDARIHIVAFDPRTKGITLSTEINARLGTLPGAFADGKIHGRLGFHGGPWLWFCTYWAKYPEPSAEDYATGYRGGHIGRYDVRTGEVVDEGVPLPRASWPSHILDEARGRLYAAGHFGEFLAWDIKARKNVHAGRLPDGMSWGNRVLLLDEPTGSVYSSETSGGDPAFPLIRYDPEANTFENLRLPMPPDEAGARRPIRAHTVRRGADALFRAVTENGVLFTFDPIKMVIEPLGLCWPGARRYTTSIASSPGGRFLYYLPGAHGDSFKDGSPLVQYDTRLGRYKVLAFLGPALLAKYGYLVGGTYSVVADTRGEIFYVFMNGAFRDPGNATPLPDQAFGSPVLLVITLAEKEER